MKKPPSTTEIKQARLTAGLTQAGAGPVVHASSRTWQNWEQGRVAMHPGLFELFLIKTRPGKLFGDKESTLWHGNTKTSVPSGK